MTKPAHNRTARGRPKPNQYCLRLGPNEIKDIAKSWKGDDGPGGEDVRKLVDHIKILESDIDQYELELKEAYEI